MTLTLTEISDRLEIEQALAAYSQAVDTHDWALLDEVFLPDADIDYRAVVPHRGDLGYTKGWLSRMTRAGTYYHLLGLPKVFVDGDTAHTRTPCFNPMPLRDDPGGRRFVGHWYRDDWVRTPPGWRIRSRVYESCYQVGVASGGLATAHGDGVPLSAGEKLLIHELYARYNQAIDRADAAGYCACFTADGTLVRNGSALTGAAELAEFAAGAATRGLKHFVSNITLEGRVVGSAAGSAQGRADVVVLRRDGDGLSVLTSGSYADRLVCSPDGWQFAERSYVTAP